jgi:hypothetical protein
MRNLTTTICLTVALLFGCTGVCKSADFQKGLTAAQAVPEIPKKNSEVAIIFSFIFLDSHNGQA